MTAANPATRDYIHRRSSTANLPLHNTVSRQSVLSQTPETTTDRFSCGWPRAAALSAASRRSINSASLPRANQRETSTNSSVPSGIVHDEYEKRHNTWVDQKRLVGVSTVGVSTIPGGKREEKKRHGIFRWRGVINARKKTLSFPVSGSWVWQKKTSTICRTLVLHLEPNVT